MFENFAVVLVGHGAAPSDCPRELVAELKAMEAKRKALDPGLSDGKPSPTEKELNRRIRRWPRDARTDPYQAGLEALAQHLSRKLGGRRVVAAYNEFCSPSLQEAVEGFVAEGLPGVIVLTTMLTPGGMHSEREIPQELKELSSKYPRVQIRYCWPFDLSLVAQMFADQIHPKTSVSP